MSEIRDHAPSDAALDALRKALPDHRFAGTYSQIDHRQVVFIHEFIQRTGVIEKVEEWAREDRQQQFEKMGLLAPPAGGRPSIVPIHTAVTLMLILSAEHSPQFVERMAQAVAHRLSRKSLRYLGIYDKRRLHSSEWYFPLRRALGRFLDPIDAFPGKRRKYPTLRQIQENLERRLSEGVAHKVERATWVCNQLLDETMQLLPPEILGEWKGDTTTDATVIPAYGKNGRPYSSKDRMLKKSENLPPADRAAILEAYETTRRGPIEPDADWYVRDSRHRETTDIRAIKKAVFGWDLTITHLTGHTPGDVPKHPLLTASVAMTVPGTALIKAARDNLTSIVERGHPVGRATGDRGYYAGAHEKDLQIPVRKLGYKIVTDYRDDQLGLKGSYGGAIQVEGQFYCPSMPKKLINASIDVKANSITETTYANYIAERKQYALRPKEKPDAKGNVPMMCPARGPGATASCPLVAACQGKDPDELTTIARPPAKPPTICSNKSSMTIPIEAAAKLIQEYPYKSEEWSAFYKSDRSTIEGVNGQAKDDSTEQIAAAGRRRLRGYTAQFLLITLLLVTHNMRKIQAFRDEMLDPTSRDQLNINLSRKLQARTQRAQRVDRVLWDNFAQRNADDDAEAEASQKGKAASASVVDTS